MEIAFVGEEFQTTIGEADEVFVPVVLLELSPKGKPMGYDARLMVCYRYIELKPLRAGTVGASGEYGWSSYAG